MKVARLTYGTVEDIWEVESMEALKDVPLNDGIQELVDVSEVPGIEVGCTRQPDGTFTPPVVD